MNHHLPCPKIVRGQEALTPEQTAYARQFAQERIAAMLSTAPIDEREAEEHLRAAYRVAGLKPVPVRWFDSPGEFILALTSSEWVSVRNRVWDRVEDRVRADLLANVKHVLADSMLHNVWHSVLENIRIYGVLSSSRQHYYSIVCPCMLDILAKDSILGNDVAHSVWSNALDDVVDDVWDNLRASMRAEEWDEEWDEAEEDGEEVEEEITEERWIYVMEEIVNGSVRAYYGADWLSFSRFFHEVFEENELIHLALFNETVSGYCLGSEQAWLVRKPIRLERDEQGRLHSADGMCIQYRDGWGFYAWHGTKCSEKLILHPEQITKEKWMNERSLEIRRIMQERLGNDHFVELVGGKCIEQGQRADLIEVDLGDDPERVARFVRVKDTSTERVYYLRVPPTLDKADEALAWTFGLEEKDYQPVQEA